MRCRIVLQIDRVVTVSERNGHGKGPRASAERRIAPPLAGEGLSYREAEAETERGPSTPVASPAGLVLPGLGHDARLEL